MLEINKIYIYIYMPFKKDKACAMTLRAFLNQALQRVGPREPFKVTG